MNRDWLIPLIAYLLGSIPFGLLIVKARGGPDVRSTGSGNIGAANVLRSAGAFAGVLTLLFDAAKGYLSVWLAGRLTSSNPRWMIAAAVLAVAGHMFPVWLGFRGGKGVATSLGVYLPLCPTAVLAAVVLWLLIVAFWRYSSLGSIAAAAVFPVLIYFLYAPGYAPPMYFTLGTVSISLMVLVKHRANMGRLLAGKENRVQFRR